jgi:hypothetical protein
MQNLCFGIESTISRYRSCEASILLHWTQNDVWECCGSFHYPSTGNKKANLVFRGTEVVKHPFYSIGPKMMFQSVLEHFANLRQVKTSKTCVSNLNTLFRGYRRCEASILLHWTQNDVGECLRAFHYLRHVKHAKLEMGP